VVGRRALIPNTVGFTLAPDWVCETISPSTGPIDRGRKMRIYAREEVRHLWIVDPMLHTLEIYRLDGERWVVVGQHGGDDPVAAEPFEALMLDPSRWWLEP